MIKDMEHFHFLSQAVCYLLKVAIEPVPRFGIIDPLRQRYLSEPELEQYSIRDYKLLIKDMEKKGLITTFMMDGLKYVKNTINGQDLAKTFEGTRDVISEQILKMMTRDFFGKWK